MIQRSPTLASDLFVLGVSVVLVFACARRLSDTAPARERSPVFGGEEPIDAATVAHAPLGPRVEMALRAVFGGHRASSWIGLGLLAALSGALVLAARRLRGGRTSYTDAIHPLALLHPGSPLLGHGIGPSATVFLAGTGLLLALDERRGTWTMLAAAVAWVLLALSGPTGRMLELPIVVLIGVSAFGRLHGHGTRTTEDAWTWVSAAAGLSTALGAALARGASRTAPGSWRDGLEAVQATLGSAGASFSPFSEIAILALVAATLGLLAGAVRAGDDRRTNLVLAAGLVGVVLVWIGAALWESPGGRGVSVVLVGPAALAWTRSGLASESTSRAVRVASFALFCAYAGANHVMRAASAGPGAVQMDLFPGRDDASGGPASRLAAASEMLQRSAWLGASPQDLAAEYAEQAGLGGQELVDWIAALERARLGPFGVPEEERDARLAPFYRSLHMFSPPPNRIRSEHSVSVWRCHDTDVVLVHAPGQIRWRVSPGTWRVSGHFCLCPGAYEGDDKTDGVEFRVEGPRRGKRVAGFDRALRPTEEDADRGMQSFSTTFETTTPSEVLLSTDPSGTPNLDWSAWADVKVEPEWAVPTSRPR